LGWTLVVTGALAIATAIPNYTDLDSAQIIAPVLVGWVALGSALAEIGTRMGVEKFPQIRRGFSIGVVVAGIALIAIGTGILYLYARVLHVMPKLVLVAAFLGIPVGVVIAAMCFENACEWCNEGLRHARLRFALMPPDIWNALRLGRVRETLERLGPTDDRGEHRLSFSYCPKCRQIALCEPEGEKPFVLQGNSARLLTDLV
jgi:hypothetical protein